MMCKGRAATLPPRTHSPHVTGSGGRDQIRVEVTLIPVLGGGAKKALSAYTALQQTQQEGSCSS